MQKRVKLKTYGAFVKWPVGVSGREHVVNMRTEDDCVRLSMIAHFCHKEIRKLKNVEREATAYKKKIREYFTFPENVSKLVSLLDFKN